MEESAACRRQRKETERQRVCVCVCVCVCVRVCGRSRDTQTQSRERSASMRFRFSLSRSLHCLSSGSSSMADNREYKALCENLWRGSACAHKEREREREREKEREKRKKASHMRPLSFSLFLSRSLLSPSLLSPLSFTFSIRFVSAICIVIRVHRKRKGEKETPLEASGAVQWVSSQSLSFARPFAGSEEVIQRKRACAFADSAEHRN